MKDRGMSLPQKKPTPQEEISKVRRLTPPNYSPILTTVYERQETVVIASIVVTGNL